MPNDLMPDTSSYADPTGNALLARGYDPSAATKGALDTAQSAMNLGMSHQVMQLRAAQISQEQLALGRQKLTALNGVLGGLVTNPTADNATSQIGWAVQNGVIDPQSATKAAGEIAALGGDPAKIKAWATDHLNQNAQHQQLMDQAYGTPGMVSNGAVSSPTMMRSGAGGGYYPAAGPNVVQQMGPGEASTPVTGPVAANGAPTVISKGQFAAGQGQGRTATVDAFGRIAYPQAAGGGTPSAPSPAPSAGQAASTPAPTAAPSGQAPSNGSGTWTPGPQTMPVVTRDQAAAAAQRVQSGQGSATDRNLLRGYAVQNNIPLKGERASTWEAQPGQPPQGRNSPTASAPAAGGAPSPMVVGLAPGTATAADATAAANVAQGQALQRAADAVPTTKATIANLESDLDKISTGPLSSRINVAKSTYNQIAGMAGLPQVDPGGVAKMEQFHKNAAILAQQQFTALGGTGTDQQLGAAIGANPSEALSSMGNKAILAMLKGNQDAIAAKNTAWQNRPAGQSYGQFAEDWNRSFSPRAFQLLYMSPQDRRETVASMSPQERAAVGAAYNTAVQRGWIDPTKAAR